MPLFIPALSLLPSGHVVFLPDGGEATLPDIVAGHIETAFHEGTAAGFFHLTTTELTTPLPSAIAFWRDFFCRGLTQLFRVKASIKEKAATAL